MTDTSENEPKKSDRASELKDGGVFNNRSCTDCCCIFLFGIMLIGWIVVCAVAFAKGDPDYIIRPTNFRGETCGKGDLTNYTNYFVPLPQRYTYGFCVDKCPQILDYVCNNDVEVKLGSTTGEKVMNTYYDHTASEYLKGAALSAKCQASCTAEEKLIAERYYGLAAKARENKCFVAIYISGSTLYRCVPFADDQQNMTLMDQLNETLGTLGELANEYGVGSFFSRGFSECQDSWLVVLISVLSCMVFSLIWILLLRWLLAPIVYFCIILVFALLIGIGYLAYRMQDDYANNVLPGDQSSEDQLIIWRVVMYTAWALAAIYFVVMLWLLQRIRIAIVIMEESALAFLNNPGLVLIPPFTCVLLLGLLALFFAATLYIQTIGELSVEDLKEGAVAVFGANAVNLTEAAAFASVDFYESISGNNVTNDTLTNSTMFEAVFGVKALHAYNFFMFLWTANFILAWGFFIMAMVVICWYFSATGVEIDQEDHGVEGGRTKTTPAGTLCRAVCVSIRYHLGTLLFGSLLIAIIQFIRAVMLYIEKNYLQKWKDNQTVKVIIWCVHCWLACIERLVKIISYNAFIICGIKCQNFLSSAVDALKLLTINILRVTILEFLSTAATFLIRLFICTCNLILAYFLINQATLTNDVNIESGLFPLALIAIVSFAIASLFVNVYQSCIDTILMCFFIDEEDMNGVFMPPSLAKIVGQFTQIAEARQKYEEMIKEATAKAEADAAKK